MKKNESVGNRKNHLESVAVGSKAFNEYSQVPGIYHEVAKNYGNNRFTNLLIKDDLVSHFAQMFTEEEASVVRHLGYYPMGKTADSVAEAEQRPVHEIQEILENLAHDRNLLISYGPSRNRRYAI